MPCHVVDKGAKVTWEQVLRHGADAAPFAWTLAEGARGGNRGRHDQVGIDDNRRAVDQAAGRRADRRRRGSASGHPLPGGRRPVESRRDLPKDMSPIRKTNRRNPEITRAAIRQAARQAFSDLGLSGARVDRIAEWAGVIHSRRSTDWSGTGILSIPPPCAKPKSGSTRRNPLDRRHPLTRWMRAPNVRPRPGWTCPDDP